MSKEIAAESIILETVNQQLSYNTIFFFYWFSLKYRFVKQQCDSQRNGRHGGDGNDEQEEDDLDQNNDEDKDDDDSDDDEGDNSNESGNTNDGRKYDDHGDNKDLRFNQLLEHQMDTTVSTKGKSSFLF
jgi:hypothetical protein